MFVEARSARQATSSMKGTGGATMTGQITRLIDLGDALVSLPATTQDLLDAAGVLLEHALGWDEPRVLYQVEGDERWYVGHVTFQLEEANPELVREVLERQAEDEADENETADEGE